MSITPWIRRLEGLAPALVMVAVVSACQPGDGSPTTPAPAATTSVVVSISGTSGSLETSLSLSGPGGILHNRTGAGAFEGLVAGTYEVRAAPATRDGHRWDPFPASQTVTVDPSTGPTTIVIEYRLATGALAVDVTGLPGGVNADVEVTGPSGFAARFAASTTIRGLEPGRYRIAMTTRTSGTAVYHPAPATDSVTVLASTTPARLVAGFVRRVGFIAIDVSGLPTGTGAALRIAGPGGFAATATGSGVLGPLDPGSYQVVADTVVAAGTRYATATQPATLTLDTGTVPVQVAYAPVTGSLALAVSGLPGGTNASITIDGPSGFHAIATGTTTWTGLAPGSYRIVATPVSAGGTTYDPSPGTQNVVVGVGPTPAMAAVAFAEGAGGLSVSITGLPGGLDAAVTVSGPGGFSALAATTRTLTGLAPGSYTVAAQAVTQGGTTWQPSPATQAVTVAAGTTASSSVAYQVTTGSLSVTVSGLPGGASADIAISGPGGFSATATGTTTWPALMPGSYQVTAAAVQHAGTTWVATPANATRAVSAGATSVQAISYAVSGGGGASLNLRIQAMYLTQAAQRLDGSVPLVAGRAAMLRVFATANEANSSAPTVRVRLYHGGVLRQTYSVTAPAAAVPLAVDESQLSRSWNVVLDPSDVVPGMSILADVDPAGSISEADETDNRYPVSGSPAPIDVRTPGPFALTFVPIQQQVNGLTGDVSGANTAQFLSEPRKLLPIADVASSVRATYVTTAPVLQSGNGNGAWGTILSELLALRAADGQSGYYYGVVKTTYGSGVAGIGYVGGSARTSLGWDKLPSGSGVMAHEIGHNLGRSHVNCGGPSNPDPNYPHAGGGIGIWGLDVGASALKSPSSYKDLMSYCGPEWVSDYTWEAMLAYRLAGANRLIADPGPRRGLLVWGRITPSGPILEPAFVVNAPPSAIRPGPHRLELRDAQGRAIVTRSFSAESHSDLPTGAEEAFAFVIPLDPETEERLGSVVLRVGAQSARISLPAGPPVAPNPTARAAGAASVLEWNPRDYPMVLVRDEATGSILSFARGGRVTLPVAAGRLGLTFTDGIRTTQEVPRLR